MGQGLSADNKKELDTVQMMIEKAAKDREPFTQLMEVKDRLERNLRSNQPFFNQKR